MTHKEAIAELVCCRMKGHEIKNCGKALRDETLKVVGFANDKYCETCAMMGLPYVVIFEDGSFAERIGKTPFSSAFDINQKQQEQKRAYLLRFDAMMNVQGYNLSRIGLIGECTV